MVQTLNLDAKQQEAADALRASLWTALTRPSGGHTTHHFIHGIAADNPPLFFEVGLAIFDSLTDLSLRVRAGARLFECPEFLAELLRDGRFSDPELQERCAAWIRLDRFFDVRLARLLPGRQDDPYQLPSKTMARILELLNHISSGPRLIAMLNHLKNHPDPTVAQRATVLVGRRIYSPHWVKQRLASTDPLIRAAAVEGLWGHDLHSARELLWQHERDENNHVAGNALLGLHFLGEPRVGELAKNMIGDQRPAFRATAAWVMGQIGHEEFVKPLEVAVADSEAAVRVAASQALVHIREGIPAEQRFAVANKTKIVPKEERPAAPAARSKTPAPKPKDTFFRFRFDGSFRESDEETSNETTEMEDRD